MLTEHQNEIYEQLLEKFLNKEHCTLSGYAGTGKSFVTSMLLRELKARHKKYLVLAPTHKALSVLANKEIELNDDLGESNTSLFKTVASYLKMRPNYQKVGMDLENPDFIFADEGDGEKRIKYNFIIIDECSMISKSVFQQLMSKPGVTYLFVGDIAQLPPIGEKVSKTFELKNIFYLNEIVRTKHSDIVDLCETARNGDFTKIKSWKSSDNVTVMSKRNYKHDCEKVLAFTNKAVANHNTATKKAVNPSNSKISKGDVIMFYQDIFTAMDPRPKWFPNYDAKNFYPDKKIVSNCDEFIIDNLVDCGNTYKMHCSREDSFISGYEFLVLQPPAYAEYIRKYLQYKSNWDLHKLFLLKYNCILPEAITQGYKDEYDDVHKLEVKKSFDLAYALTVHKAQGSTYDTIAVDVNDIFVSKSDTQTLLYTAISRAKEHVVLLM